MLCIRPSLAQDLSTLRHIESARKAKVSEMEVWIYPHMENDRQDTMAKVLTVIISEDGKKAEQYYGATENQENLLAVFEWNKQSQLIRQSYPAEGNQMREIAYTYNEYGKLIEERSVNSGRVEMIKAYRYSPSGELREMGRISGNADTTFEYYDQLGRLCGYGESSKKGRRPTSEERWNNDSTKLTIKQFTDPEKQKFRVETYTYNKGTAILKEKSIHYSFDEDYTHLEIFKTDSTRQTQEKFIQQGRKGNVKQNQIRKRYDDHGKLIEEYSSLSGGTTSISYNEKGLISEMQKWTDQGEEAEVVTFVYKWN